MSSASQKHLFIEASAGTGKTYRIEQLVTQLVAEKGVPLQQILIVTFTEKATGELRRRIRARLEQHLRQEEATGEGRHLPNIRASLDSFDEASIYTIHGFCQRILSEYAFETRQPFHARLLEDPKVGERLFARQLRGTWPKTLFAADRDPVGCRRAHKDNFHRKTLVQLVPKILEGDIIRPGDEALASLTSEVEDLLRVLCQAPLSDHAARLANMPELTVKAEFESKTLQGQPKKKAFSYANNLAPAYMKVCRVVNSGRTGRLDSQVLEQLLDWKRPARLFDNRASLQEYSYMSETQVEAVERLFQLKATLNARQGALKARAARDLYQSYKSHKELGGLMDFNDLIHLLRQAVAEPDSLLVQVLRERYRCALVDEFQDTDHVQWDIFRRVFLESPDHQLIVVGDPKQAIYSFRGANIGAYQAARGAFGNQTDPLGTNYRSDPGLLESLNRVFANNWFSGDIEYTAVGAPPLADRRARTYRDESGRAPLTLVRGDKVKGSAFRAQYARFVTREIEHLLNSNIEIAEKRGDQHYRRPLNAGDICILVRSRSEFSSLKRELRKAGIPFSFGKMTGIFGSHQATEWRYLLRALSSPSDNRAVMKALFTSFFHCRPEAVEQYPELSEGHPLRQAIKKWHLLAQEGEWSKFFRTILTESGVLLRAMAEQDGDRRVTNHQHLSHLLHERATRQGSNLTDLIRYLEAQILLDDNEKNLQRLETEQPRVQAMTIHASKGLEFPVVFLSGGFTENKNPGEYASYLQGSGRIYDFAGAAESAQEELRQRQEELRRLFYVALTRAQYKLYVPWMPREEEPGETKAPKKDGAEQKTPSKPAPLDSFVTEALQALTEAEAAQLTFLKINAQGHILEPTVAATPNLMDTAAVPLLPDGDSSRQLVVQTASPPVPPKILGRRTVRTHSFSGLAKGHAAEKEESTSYQPHPVPGAQTPARPLDDDDSGDPELETIAEETGPQQVPRGEWLPRGADTGSLLHEVLENLVYARVGALQHWLDLLVQDSPERQLLEGRVLRYLGRRLEQRQQDLEAVAELVWNALRTPLDFLGGQALCEVKVRRHELEFWIPTERRARPEGPAAGGSLAPGVTQTPDFLNGFIDLIFEHQDKYFILDWKSNSHPEYDYGPEGLKSMMDSHNYHLQYRIYVLALDKILKLTLKNYDAATHLGGVCYLFLRGVDAGRPGAGVHFVPAEQLDLAAYQADLESRLGRDLRAQELI